MKILVTGATGFLGNAIVQNFCRRTDWSVSALVRNPNNLRNPFNNNVTLFRGDLRVKESLGSALKDQELVIHCGALCSPYGKKNDFLETNFDGTRNLYEEAYRHKVKKFIFVSSPSIYFGGKPQELVKESDSPHLPPLNYYSLSKLKAENYLRENQRLPFIILRPRAIFGPGDTTVLPRIIMAQMKNRLPLFYGGNVWVDLTYIDNVIDAIELAVLAPKELDFEDYNITNDDPRSLKDLLNLLFHKLDMPFAPVERSYKLVYAVATFLEGVHLAFSLKEPALTKTAVTYLAKGQTFDISKAKNDLNYRPRVSIEKGIDQFCTWWKSLPGTS